MKLSRLLLALVFGCIGVQPLTARAEERDEVLPVKPDARQIIRLLTPDPPAWLEPAPPHIPYPEAMAEHCAEGSVVLEFTITAEGKTADITTIRRTAPLFEHSAKKRASLWRYRPTFVDGEAVPRPKQRVEIQFKLGSPDAKATCERDHDLDHARFDVPEPPPTLRVPPRYPTGVYPVAEAAVQVGFSIAEDGSVTDMVILSSEIWAADPEQSVNPGQSVKFERTTLRALEQWTYPPPTIKGKPARQKLMRIKIEYRFADGAKDRTDDRLEESSASEPEFMWSYR